MVGKKQNSEIPYFIKIRGCINCEASKSHKEKTGKDYGFDHELMVRCIIGSCGQYNVSLVHPFYDPEEIVRFAKSDGHPEAIERAKKYCYHVKEVFGSFYNALGISIDDIIEKL